MLLNRLKELGLIECFSISDGYDFQKSIAPILRKIAVRHLKQGDGPVAKGYRENVAATAVVTPSNHLEMQSRDGVWADYVMLAALAEALDVNFIVNHKKATMAIRTSLSPDSPIVVLENNANNTAWDYRGESGCSSTLHDGNCGYNSFAQALQALVAPIIQAEQDRLMDDSSLSVGQQLLSVDQVSLLLNAQRSQMSYYKPVVERAIQTGQAGEQAFNTYLSTLSADQQHHVKQQIDADRAFALSIAAADANKAGLFSTGVKSPAAAEVAFNENPDDELLITKCTVMPCA